MAVVKAPVTAQKMIQFREGSLRGRAGRPSIFRAGLRGFGDVVVEAAGLGLGLAAPALAGGVEESDIMATPRSGQDLGETMRRNKLEQARGA